MILIFGGTTEGRIAVEVCDQAGKPFFYSTKGNLQDVEMHNGVRLSGVLSANDIKTFCMRHSIGCIIDAAHPFAENLHKAIGEAGVPVIRLQRSFPKHTDGVTYCRNYDDAARRMEADDVGCLLALSGVNTISKLRGYWTAHKTFFRILNRKESTDKVHEAGFPDSQIILYNDSLSLPSADDELQLMRQVGCDAILTKESGTSGGFEAKVSAARRLGLKVYVIECPRLPQQWTYVTGRYGLRRSIEQMLPTFFPLKTGLTTGACATAAAKAALLSLLYDDDAEEVSFALPDGEILSIAVEHDAKGVASVTKDYSDDPDVTKGCRITANVVCHASSGKDRAPVPDHTQQVRFLKGKGVGTVTLPGLGIPVGEPAVNPTPRKMISDEISRLTHADVDVTISVENGEDIATRTFNPRVGVLDGISILGTSGIVHPLSNDAFIRSIRRELEVAWAIGRREIGLVAGMKSERALKKEKDIRCVHYGNFIGEALKAAHEIGFRHATLAIMIGKAVKLAAGNLDTHSHKVVMDKDFLVSTARSLNIDPSPIRNITMARELWDIMPESFFERIKSLCHENCMTVFPQGEIKIILICDTLQ